MKVADLVEVFIRGVLLLALGAINVIGYSQAIKSSGGFHLSKDISGWYINLAKECPGDWYGYELWKRIINSEFIKETSNDR